MKVSTWLVIKKNASYSGSASVRTTSSKPDVASNEVCTKLNISIPDEMFDKPQIEINLEFKANPLTFNVIAEEGGLSSWLEDKEKPKKEKDYFGEEDENNLPF